MDTIIVMGYIGIIAGLLGPDECDGPCNTSEAI